MTVVSTRIATTVLACLAFAFPAGRLRRVPLGLARVLRKPRPLGHHHLSQANQTRPRQNASDCCTSSCATALFPRNPRASESAEQSGRAGRRWLSSRSRRGAPDAQAGEAGSTARARTRRGSAGRARGRGGPGAPNTRAPQMPSVDARDARRRPCAQFGTRRAHGQPADIVRRLERHGVNALSRAGISKDDPPPSTCGPPWSAWRRPSLRSAPPGAPPRWQCRPRFRRSDSWDSAGRRRTGSVRRTRRPPPTRPPSRASRRPSRNSSARSRRPDDGWQAILSRLPRLWAWRRRRSWQRVPATSPDDAARVAFFVGARAGFAADRDRERDGLESARDGPFAAHPRPVRGTARWWIHDFPSRRR